MPRKHAAMPLLPPSPQPPEWNNGRLHLQLAGREFELRRDEDMEALWEQMGQDGFGADEHMPYWAEIWPASLLLAAWIGGRRDQIAGRRCLDLGCGMGLSALAGAASGARVVAVDYEEAAVAHAARNARINGLDVALAVMDWRYPCFAEGSFDCVWGSDILYETRFYEPLVRIFRTLPAPGGRIFLSEPDRQVSRPVWERLAADGFSISRLHEEPVAFSGYRMTVSLYEISI